MGLRTGPLKVRLTAGDSAADPGLLAELRRRAAAEGLALAAPGEEADLVAVPAPHPDGRAKPGAAKPGAPGRGSGGPAGELGLSGRESEILEYLADGWSNAEIASALGIGQRTVRSHVESILDKLGVSRRGEAVAEAARRGLVRFDF